MTAQLHYTQIIVAPLVTEKSHRLADKHKTVVFKVKTKATKFQIQEAVEKLFDVKVAKVATVLIKGKIKNFAGRSGKRSDVKKAYVTLKEGFDINFAGQ
jgi:large subunit ribosomal protein L23